MISAYLRNVTDHYSDADVVENARGLGLLGEGQEAGENG